MVADLWKRRRLKRRGRRYDTRNWRVVSAKKILNAIAERLSAGISQLPEQERAGIMPDALGRSVGNGIVEEEQVRPGFGRDQFGLANGQRLAAAALQRELGAGLSTSMRRMARAAAATKWPRSRHDRVSPDPTSRR
jgi:hypothetical protein